MSRKTLYQQNKSRGLRAYLNAAILAHNLTLAKRYAAAKRNRMAVYAHDEIGTYINQLGMYDGDELETLFAFLRPLHAAFKEGVALDIGANIGNHSVYFSDYFKCLHSFEPNPTAYELLSINTRHLKNTSIHNFGLGDAKGVYCLEEKPGNIGASGIVCDDSREGSKKVDIHVEKLDNLELDLDGLCFVKIDVEGFESNVLKGGLNTIRMHQPVVAVEQHEFEFVSGTTPSISMLEELGYRFCWYQAGIASENAVLRRLQNIKELFGGRKQKIVSDEAVPAGDYSMLTAVPQRFQSALIG